MVAPTASPAERKRDADARRFPSDPAHLTRLLSVLMGVAGAYLAVFAGLAVLSPSPALAAPAVAGAVVGVSGWLGSLLVSRGNATAAALVASGGVLAAVLWVGSFFPALYPAAVLGAAVAVVMALPYVGGRQLIGMSVTAFLCVVVVSLEALIGPASPSPLSEAVRGGILAFTLLLEMLVLTVSLNQFREQLGKSFGALSEAITFRDEFISIASHELRTPLTALRLQLGRMQGARVTEPQRVEMQERALWQTDRLSRLVDDLLDTSRLTSGRLPLQRETCDLSAIARSTAALFAGEAAKIRSALNISGAEAVTGSWDPLRLEQTVSNLLSNALKYGAGKPVDVVVSSEGETAILRVSDHGVGIAPRDVPRLFAPFSRVHRDPSVGGFGLGLYVSQQIVEAHGGRIEVSSAVGEGTTFTVRLPLPQPL